MSFAEIPAHNVQEFAVDQPWDAASVNIIMTNPIKIN